ncbi:MAG: hypothetical protein JSS61_03490 [Verrucomicrobia bacterium]|nr:hypothetical protein [Verrucomicrobiota bacterium]
MKYNQLKRLIEKNLSAAALMAVGLAFLAAGWERHQTHHMKPVAQELLESFSEGQHVGVVAHALTPDESKKLFGHDLISRGVQPVHLTIENHSASRYVLEEDVINLPCIEARDVAFRVSKSAIPRGIMYRVASLIFWPFSIPSSIDGMRTFVKHRQLKRDLKAKVVKHEVVPEYATIGRVVFVPVEGFSSAFKVTLTDEKTRRPLEFQMDT